MATTARRSQPRLAVSSSQEPEPEPEPDCELDLEPGSMPPDTGGGDKQAARIAMDARHTALSEKPPQQEVSSRAAPEPEAPEPEPKSEPEPVQEPEPELGSELERVGYRRPEETRLTPRLT